VISQSTSAQYPYPSLWVQLKHSYWLYLAGSGFRSILTPDLLPTHRNFEKIAPKYKKYVKKYNTYVLPECPFFKIFWLRIAMKDPIRPFWRGHRETHLRGRQCFSLQKKIGKYKNPLSILQVYMLPLPYFKYTKLRTTSCFHECKAFISSSYTQQHPILTPTSILHWIKFNWTHQSTSKYACNIGNYKGLVQKFRTISFWI
jgi:hypothetical protein